MKQQGARRRRRGNQRGGQNGTQEVTQSLITLRPSYGPVVKISRSVAPFEWSTQSATLTDGSFALGWSLSDVPSVAEFTSLFQQWRLRAARVTLTWRSLNETNPVRPTIYFGVDPFVDPAVPPTLLDALQRPHRTWTPNAMRTIVQLRPQLKVVGAVFATPSTTSVTMGNATAPAGQWYDCATSSTVNYGTFWAVVQTWSATTGVIRVQQEFDLEFRGPR